MFETGCLLGVPSMIAYNLPFGKSSLNCLNSFCNWIRQFVHRQSLKFRWMISRCSLV